MFSLTRNKNNVTKTLLCILLIHCATTSVSECKQQYPLTTNNSDYSLNNNVRVQKPNVDHVLSRNLVMAQMANPAPTTQAPQLIQVPDFSEPIGNHTIAMGRDAQFSCKINNLGNFRTAWLRVEDKGILTIHNNIITRNYRIGLINNEEGRNFILTIKNVQPSDKGGYMCQINSVPMRYAIGYLDVLTPPVFDDSPIQTQNSDGSFPLITTTLSPGTQQAAALVTVSEGSNATLTCRASGHPSPVMTWRREDNEPIFLNGALTSDGLAKVEGSTIVLNSVSRLNSGAYLCIASNGVQPSASKRQVLDVQFKPVIRLPQTELSAHVGQTEARLICFVELNPLGTYHWVRLDSQRTMLESSTGASNEDDQTLIEHEELMNSDKFDIVIKQLNSEKVQMILNLRRIERKDFGWYRCIARNSLGIQSNSIRLYESSSFSLNSMFRGSGSGHVNDIGPTNPDSPEAQQNDQQQQPTNQTSNGGKQSINGKSTYISSRAHTRSSWIQRPSTGRQNELSDPSSSALSNTFRASSAISLLLSHLHLTILLLLNCIILSSSLTRSAIIVANESPNSHRR